MDIKRRAPFLSLDVTGYVVVVVVVVFFFVVVVLLLQLLFSSLLSVHVRLGLSVCPLVLFVHLYALLTRCGFFL